MRKINVNHNPDSDNRVNHIFGIFEAGGSIASSLINKSAQEETNDQNFVQWQNELNYKLQRDAIEDARYQDEIGYQRALQQTLFDREDTAIERQASQLSKLGINPLSQNMNGLPAGQAVPTGSSRQVSDQLPQFRAQPFTGFNLALSSNFLNQIDQLQTNGVQRDLLNSQKNYQDLVNMAYANRNGITLDSEGNPISIAEDVTEQDERKQNREIRDEEKRDKYHTANRNQRVDEMQYETGATDKTSSVLQPAYDASWQAGRVATNIKRAYNDHIDRFDFSDDSSKTSLNDRLGQVKNAVFTTASNLYMKGQQFLKKLSQKNNAINYDSDNDRSGRMR